jgi:hypothetical protein
LTFEEGPLAFDSRVVSKNSYEALENKDWNRKDRLENYLKVEQKKIVVEKSIEN